MCGHEYLFSDQLIFQGVAAADGLIGTPVTVPVPPEAYRIEMQVVGMVGGSCTPTLFRSRTEDPSQAFIAQIVGPSVTVTPPAPASRAANGLRELNFLAANIAGATSVALIVRFYARS